jgi:thymidylate synthase (FAD)
MQIVEPYAKMMPIAGLEAMGYDRFQPAMGNALLSHVEWCSRISHRSEEAVTADSWQRIIKSVVLEHGDWSVTEHAVVSVDAYVDRGITHEWVRHRMGAYTQESTRFVNYTKKMLPSFIYPEVDVECKRCLAGSEVKWDIASQSWRHYTPDLVWESCSYHPQWLHAISSCEDQYKELVRIGWRPQEARSVFPNALASRIIVTYNLRNWRHFFIMRTTKETHPQMKQVSIPLLEEFKQNIPLLYDDIEPNARQVDNLKKAR